MPTLEQIRAWAAGGESEIMEFKRSTGVRREAIQTLCAMLNTRGGRVLIGVEPDGKVVGQQVVDKTVEDVAQEIKEIDPPVFPSVERVPVNVDREVLVLTTGQGSVRPYVYRERAYKRVGNTSPEMSREEYNRMLLERLHGEERWENRPLDGWSTADLDVAELTLTLEEAIRRGRSDDPGTRQPEEILRGLGLTKDGRMLRAATVLFGKAERLEAEFPQCLLRLAKFRGSDKTEFLDNRQFHGNAFDLLQKAERFLRESLPIASRVVPDRLERVDEPLYPPEALREALANAFCHRDYSIGGGSVAVAIYQDRLEVTSSGPLHFGLTAAALFEPHESLPWNPLIARVFYRRGIVEAWGRGTLKMAELAAKARLPRPEIEEAGGCVVVRFLPSRYVPPVRVQMDLSARQQELLVLMDSAGRMAFRDIKAALPARSRKEIKNDLEALKNVGLIRSEGRGRTAFWYRNE